MRQLTLLVAIGICHTLFIGSVSSHAAGCAAETKATQAAEAEVDKATDAHVASMDALAKATSDLLAAQRDYISASVKEAQAFQEDAAFDKAWVACIESPYPRDCSVENQARVRADKRAAQAVRDLARATDRLHAAEKAAKDAATTEQADLAKRDAAVAAYNAARDRETKCLEGLPKTPPPARKQSKV